jgi:DNA-binding response OmpR family regulator
MVTQEELQRVLAAQQNEVSSHPLASRLTENGIVGETDALKALSEQWGVPGIDLRQVIISSRTLGVVPREVAEARRLLPLMVDDGKLFVAMADPSDRRIIDELEFATSLQVFPFVTLENALQKAIDGAYDTMAAGKSEYIAPNASPRARVEVPQIGSAAVVVDEEMATTAEHAEVEAGDFGDTRDEVSSVMSLPLGAHGDVVSLVADADEEVRKSIRRLLTEWGHRVIEAEKGVQALRIVKEDQVDLIILDAMLPEVHGFDIAKQLKGSVRYGRIPIIMLSGDHRGERIVEDVKANYGIDEYMEKPFASSGFLQAVARVLQLAKERTTALRDPEAMKAEAKATLDEGVRAYKEGRVAEAIEHLKKGIKIDPLAYRLRYHLGLLYGKHGKVHDGIAELERAIELNPEAFVAVKNLAVLYEKGAFKNKARVMWERSLHIAPDEATRRQIEEHLATLQ